MELKYIPRKHSKIEHLAWLIASLVGFFCLYYLTQIELIRAAILIPDTWVDRQVFFSAWTVVIYITHYPLLLTAWYLNLHKSPSHFFTPFFTCAVISFLVFLLFPTFVLRPDVTDSIWHKAYLILHLLDKPTNCLPSLHVSLALTAGLSISHVSKQKKFLFWIWVLGVCVSTLTTKQHVFVDVVGGVVVAIIANKFSKDFGQNRLR